MTDHAVVILVTASREWTDRGVIERALAAAIGPHSSADLPVLRHGGARGGDALAGEVWARWRTLTPPPGRPAFAPAQVYRAREFASPRERNAHMVALVPRATVCLAFATSWASGTGMCARMARRAGIRTIDYGVSTHVVGGATAGRL